MNKHNTKTDIETVNRKICRIEQIYGVSFENLLRDFLKPDYIGKSLSIVDIAVILGLSEHVIRKNLAKYKITVNQRGGAYIFIPTRTEDLCWVERGITMESFIRRCSAMWMTTEEIAMLLKCPHNVVRNYIRSHHIKFYRYVRVNLDFGRSRKGKHAFNPHHEMISGRAA